MQRCQWDGLTKYLLDPQGQSALFPQQIKLPRCRLQAFPDLVADSSSYVYVSSYQISKVVDLQVSGLLVVLVHSRSCPRKFSKGLKYLYDGD